MAQIYDITNYARPVVMPLGEGDAPAWATGLRQLYKAAVAEPLPADFSDLLATMESQCRSGTGC